MRILIIAPTHATLPSLHHAAREAAAAANAHPGSKLLLGDVAEEDIHHQAGAGAFDLMWLATHAAGEHLVLSNSTLHVDRLIPLIRASGAPAVYLNTCDSVTIGQRIVEQTQASVICTIGSEIGDAAAMTTGSLFASMLAATDGDIRSAYERSKPSPNDHYLFLANAKPAPAAAKPTAKPTPSKRKPPAQPQIPSGRKRGGQPGNLNALKHGIYARNVRPAEVSDLDLLIEATGLADEIGVMRVNIRRLLDQTRDEREPLDLPTTAIVLDHIGTASIRLASLLKTQRLIDPEQKGNDVARAIGDAIGAIAKEMQLC